MIHTLVAQIKVNIFNIWPKINTLILSFTLFRGVRGIAVKIMNPIGCLMGLGVISPPGVGGGVLPMWLFQNVKMALGFNFCF